jgi:hypothetical protein
VRVHITGYREGFDPVPQFDDTGIAFGVLKLAAVERREVTAKSETVFLQSKEREP